MALLSLPTDVLLEILHRCTTVAALIATSQDLADLALGTPSLWQSITLKSFHYTANGPNILRSRLARSMQLPLTVSITVPDSEIAFANEMWVAMSRHSGRVERLTVDASTSFAAGTLFLTLFTPLLEEYSMLKHLIIKVKEEEEDYERRWPHLDQVLRRTLPSAPKLEHLAISSYLDCIPSFHGSIPPKMENLTTLVLNGYFEIDAAPMSSVVDLLYHTPHLETLWLKSMGDDTIDSYLQLGKSPATLPRLQRLAVSIPGAGGVFVGRYLNAPELRDLHLDGSRGPFFPEFHHGEYDCRLTKHYMIMAIKSFAERSPKIRRLALTATVISQETWRWLFGCDEHRYPPFPELESLGLRKLGTTSLTTAHFPQSLLIEYSVKSYLQLHRLSIRRCSIPLDGPTMLLFSTNIVKRGAASDFVLELDKAYEEVKDEHVVQLVEAGGTFERIDQAGHRGWWDDDHNIDGRDLEEY